MMKRATGFTIPETLIAITAAGILGSAMLGLTLAQSRFYGHSEDTINAQHTTRVGSDLMASELRMASPEDIIGAGGDTVRIRHDVFRALVCDVTGADEATLFVYDSVPPVDLSAVRGTAYSEPYDSTYAYADTWTGTVTATGGGPEADCVALGAPAGAAGSRYVSVTGWTGQFGDVPDRGSVIRIYGQLTFRLRTAQSGNGLALYRQNVEIAGPFGSGALFRYVMADGTVQTNPAPADLDDIRQVRIQVVARGDGSNPYRVNRAFRGDMPLRN